MMRWIFVVLLLWWPAQNGFAENTAARTAPGTSSAKNSLPRTAEQKTARVEELKDRLKAIDRMLEKVEVLRDYYPDRLEPFTDELQAEAEQINEEINTLKGKTAVKKSTASVSREQVSLMTKDQNKPAKKVKAKKRQQG